MDFRSSSNDDVLDIAHDWARRGIPVFPIAVGRDGQHGKSTKRPLTNHGHKDASTSGADVHALFSDAVPRLRDGEVLGVGARPGPAGYVVLDLDVRPDKDGLTFAKEVLHLPPHTFRVETGSGGLHVWLKKREDAPIGNASPWARDGVDVRADDGWVVVHATAPWGRWQAADHSWEDGCARVPEDVWRALIGTAKPSAATRGRSTSWSKWDPDAHLPLLHPSIPDLLRELESEGATVLAFREREGGEPFLDLTCDGSSVSATLGYISPTGLYVFSESWPGRSSGAQDVAKSAATARPGDVAQSTVEEGLKAGALRSVPLAARLVSEHPDRWRYVPGLGWLEWDGRRYRKTPVEEVTHHFATWCRDFVASLVAAGVSHEVVRHASKYLDIGNVKALVDAAKGECLTQASHLDAVPYLLNCANGVVDLRSGELLEHDPSFLMTKCTEVNYDPTAIHSDWDSALTALPEDAEEWMQDYIGIACFGSPGADDINVILYGGGANGKSTFIAGVFGALGDYAKPIAKSILFGRADEHPTQFMDLRGLRLAIMEETDATHQLNTVRLKDVSGTQMIKGRHMRQDFIEFPATHTLLIATNHRPGVSDVDHGTWRRLLLVPFDRVFEPGKGLDTGLRQRIQTSPTGQHDAALAWAVKGAARAWANGLTVPATPISVEVATETWRSENDAVMQFIERECIFDSDPKTGWVEVTDFVNTFNAAGLTVQPWGARTLQQRLLEHPLIAGKVFKGKHPKTRRAILLGLRFRDTFDASSYCEGFEGVFRKVV